MTRKRQDHIVPEYEDVPAGTQKAEDLGIKRRRAKRKAAEPNVNNHGHNGPNGHHVPNGHLNGNGAAQRNPRAKGANAIGNPGQNVPALPDPANNGPAKLIPLVQIHAGRLSQAADEAEAHLIKYGVPFFQRGSQLVRPVMQTVSVADDRKTKTAALIPVSERYMRDQLCRNMTFEKFVRREREWIPTDVPKDISETILARVGDWDFAPVNGVITTPTLRSDGTILRRPGYDLQTGLILMDPPSMPDIPEHPTRKDAIAALGLLDELLSEFPFLNEASKSVGRSALITPVVRGAMPVAPMHVMLAPTAGSGKSYFIDLVSMIAMGEKCPAIAFGKDEAESEKRIGSCAYQGYPLLNLDNVNGELFGDFLCQAIEREFLSLRILGRTEQVRFANRMTLFATGNNIRLVGDLTRRAIICTLDAKVEQPELRSFKGDPIRQVLADRGRYIAAILTIVRAYIAAGQPNKLPRLGSFEWWSDNVRAALVWLGCADPVETIAVARADDPELQELTAIVDAWREEIGVGKDRHCTAVEVLTKAQQKDIRYDDQSFASGSDDWKHPMLREAIEGLGLHRSDSVRALGKRFAKYKGRIVNGHGLMNLPSSRKNTLRWYLEKVS